MKRLKLQMSEMWRIYSMIALLNVLSLGLLVYALHFHHQHAHAVHQQQQQLQRLQIRQNELHMAQATIKQYLPQYQRLMTQSFLSQTQRTLWVDQLRKIQQTHQLFPVSYKLLAPQAYIPEFSSQQQGLQLYRSTMKLDIDLLHEGDLLQLLDSLKSSQVGTFIVRECKINQRNAFSIAHQKLAPNLHALCTIDWLTTSEKTLQQGHKNP